VLYIDGYHIHKGKYIYLGAENHNLKREMVAISYDQLWSLIDAWDWETLRSLLEELKNEKCAVVESEAIVGYCLGENVPMDVFESSLHLCLEFCHPSFLNNFEVLGLCDDPLKLERLLRVGMDPNSPFRKGEVESLLEDKIHSFLINPRFETRLDAYWLRMYRMILVLLKYGADYRKTSLCNEDPDMRVYCAFQIPFILRIPLMITLCSAIKVRRLGTRSELRWVPMDLLRTLDTFL
jgi:hypothetical protein